MSPGQIKLNFSRNQLTCKYIWGGCLKSCYAAHSQVVHFPQQAASVLFTTLHRLIQSSLVAQTEFEAKIIQSNSFLSTCSKLVLRGYVENSTATLVCASKCFATSTTCRWGKFHYLYQKWILKKMKGALVPQWFLQIMLLFYQVYSA